MPKITLVTVPYFFAPFHRRWAERTLASLPEDLQLKRIAVINKLRPKSDDQKWVEENFDCLIKNDQNCLALAWNKGIDQALADKADFVIVTNLDLIFHPLCLQNLITFAQQQPQAIVWSATRWHNLRTLSAAKLNTQHYESINWSCFMLNSKLFELVGRFDQQFSPAYHEDSDMHKRIEQSGLKGYNTENALFYHVEAATLKGCLDPDLDPELEADKLLLNLRSCIRDNDQRFIKKWGALP